MRDNERMEMRRNEAMTKKYKVSRVHGIKAVSKIEKNHNRESFPKPAVFKTARDYDRNKEKMKLAKEIDEY